MLIFLDRVIKAGGITVQKLGTKKCKEIEWSGDPYEIESWPEPEELCLYEFPQVFGYRGVAGYRGAAYDRDSFTQDEISEMDGVVMQLLEEALDCKEKLRKAVREREYIPRELVTELGDNRKRAEYVYFSAQASIEEYRKKLRT